MNEILYDNRKALYFAADKLKEITGVEAIDIYKCIYDINKIVIMDEYTCPLEDFNDLRNLLDKKWEGFDIVVLKECLVCYVPSAPLYSLSLYLNLKDRLLFIIPSATLAGTQFTACFAYMLCILAQADSNMEGALYRYIKDYLASPMLRNMRKPLIDIKADIDTLKKLYVHESNSSDDILRKLEYISKFVGSIKDDSVLSDIGIELDEICQYIKRQHNRR